LLLFPSLQYFAFTVFIRLQFQGCLYLYCCLLSHSGLSGFGAGILMTTFLSVSTDLRQQQVIGMSLASLALPNIAQSLMHLRAGTVNKPVALAICAGALIGAPLGQCAAALEVDDRTLRYVFAGVSDVHGRAVDREAVKTKQ
jgi:uncharacterized membrane protein YfcA